MVLPDNGAPVFLATLANGVGGTTPKNNEGIWTTGTDGSLQILVRTGTTIGSGTVTALSIFDNPATVSGQSRSFNNTGGITFLATLQNGKKTTQGVFIAESGTIAQVAATGTSAETEFKALDMPAINAQGQTAFKATLNQRTNNIGIWAESGTDALTLNLIAQIGEPAPDATGAQVSGTFASLRDPVLNDNDEVAFIGTLKNANSAKIPVQDRITAANDQGIWLWSGPTQTTFEIIRTGIPAEGSNGKFAFQQACG